MKERTVPSDSSERIPSSLESACVKRGRRAHALSGSYKPPFQLKHLGFPITRAVLLFI